MNIAMSPHANNLLKKIFDTKTYLRADMIKEIKVLNKTRCLMTKDPSMLHLFKSDLFTVGSEVFFDFTFIYQSQLDIIKKYWLSEKIIQEYDLVMYFNNNDPFTKLYWPKV